MSSTAAEVYEQPQESPISYTSAGLLLLLVICLVYYTEISVAVKSVVSSVITPSMTDKQTSIDWSPFVFLLFFVVLLFVLSRSKWFVRRFRMTSDRVMKILGDARGANSDELYASILEGILHRYNAASAKLPKTGLLLDGARNKLNIEMFKELTERFSAIHGEGYEKQLKKQFVVSQNKILSEPGETRPGAEHHFFEFVYKQLPVENRTQSEA